MAGITRTFNENGDETATEISQQVVTISFGRKNGKPGYSNEELNMFVQVPVNDYDSLEELEKQVSPTVNWLKAYVYTQTGTEFVNENGLISAVEGEEAPKRKAAAKPKAAKAKAAAPEGGEEAFWMALAHATPEEKGGFRAQDGDLIYDNRESKRNPKAPDFKFADADFALWLDSKNKPEWFKGPGEGI